MLGRFRLKRAARSDLDDAVAEFNRMVPIEGVLACESCGKETETALFATPEVAATALAGFHDSLACPDCKSAQTRLLRYRVGTPAFAQEERTAATDERSARDEPETGQFCPGCGARASILDDGGPVFLIRPRDTGILRAFVVDQLDRFVRCDAGCVLGVAPTVVWLGEPDALMALSPRWPSFDEADPGLRRRIESALPAGRELRQAPGASELRAELIALAEEAASILEDFAFLPSEEVNDLWRTIDPTVMSFGVLVAQLDGDPDGYPPDLRPLVLTSGPAEHDGVLGVALTRVWIGVALAWAGDPLPRRGSFEEDLVRFVDEMPYLPSAVANYTQYREAVLQGRPPGTATGFLLSALLESARASRQDAVPAPVDEPHWAAEYLMHEYHAHASHRQRLRLWRRSYTRQTRIRIHRRRISLARARMTISDQAMAEAMRNLAEALFDGDEAALAALWRDLAEIVEAVGVRIEKFDMRVLPSGETTDLKAALERIVMRDGPLSLHLLSGLGTKVVAEGRLDELEAVVDATLAQNSRAGLVLEAWLVDLFCEAGQPARVLARVGETTRPAELRDHPFVIASLAVSRARALLDLHERRKALAALSHLDIPAEGPLNDMMSNVVLMRARLLRGLGKPDECIRMLRDLAQRGPMPETYPAYESLGATYMHLGQYALAAVQYDMAVRAAAAASPDTVPILQGQLLLARASAGLPVDREMLDRLSSADGRFRAEVLVMAARVWLLLRQSGILSADDIAVADAAFDRLPALAEARREAGDANSALGALTLWADSATSPDQTLERFRRLHEMSDAEGMYAEEKTLVVLAGLEYRLGDPEAARQYLREALLVSLNTLKENPADYRLVAGMRTHLAEPYDGLLAVLVDRRDWTELRLAAELRRDAVRRAISNRDFAYSVLGTGLSDETLRGAAVRGDLMVIERIVTAGRSEIVFTHVTEETVAVRVPEQLAELDDLGRQLQYQLNSWTTHRPGDPFATGSWAVFSAWLAGRLAGVGHGGEHVVVIDDQRDDSAIPWHVALADLGRTCSYSGGWVDLLASAAAQTAPPQSLAVAVVPRSGDRQRVTEAFRSGSDAIVTAARDTGLSAQVVDGVRCTVDAFNAAMREADLAVWLVHGFVSADTGTAGLMLAADGRLPLSHAVAAASPAGRLHRLPATDAHLLAPSPATVISAACRSGVSYLVGLGERLGWYAVLRANGTQTFIGPQWDVVADATVPLAAQLTAAILAGESPAAAVKRVSDAAIDSGLPAWQARSLIVEGAW